MSVPTSPIINMWPQCGINQITFFWSPPSSDGGSPIINYTLENLSISFSQIVTNTFYTVTGLTNGVDYTFTVRANNINGSSVPVTLPKVQPGTTPFGPVTATASTVNLSTALVSWIPSTIVNEGSVKWYVIEGIPSTLSLSTFYKTDYNFKSTKMITDLTPDTYYKFTVFGVNDVGYCPPRASTILYMPPIPPLYDGGEAVLATRVTGNTDYVHSTSITDSSGNVYIRYRIEYTGTNPPPATHTIYQYTTDPVGGGAVGTSVWGTITGGSYYVIAGGGYASSYVVKYNSAGVPQWATIVPISYQLSGEGNTQNSEMVIDSENNLYITGCLANQNAMLYNYSSAPVSGGAVGVTQYGTLQLNSGNNYSPGAYLIKYATSGVNQGKVAWASQIMSAGIDIGVTSPSLTTDSANNLIVSFYASMSSSYVLNFYEFTSAPVSAGAQITTTAKYKYGNASGTRGCWFVKYNSSGVIQWFTGVDQTSGDDQIWSSMVTDSSNNIYAVVRLAATSPTIKNANGNGGGSDPKTFLLTAGSTISNTGTSGALVVKYNSSGALVWATRIDNTSSSIQRKIFISKDSSDNIYVSGEMTINNTAGARLTLFHNNGNGGLGGSGITTTEWSRIPALSSGSGATTFLVKYNSNGRVQWGTYIQGNQNSIGRSICDSDGNFYMVVYGSAAVTPFNYTSGSSGSSIVVSAYGSIPYSGGSSGDIYIVKFNSSGTVVWATRVAGTLNDRLANLSISSDGFLYVTGLYKSSPVTISNANGVSGGTVQLVTYGTLAAPSTDQVFLVKYKT